MITDYRIEGRKFTVGDLDKLFEVDGLSDDGNGFRIRDRKEHLWCYTGPSSSASVDPKSRKINDFFALVETFVINMENEPVTSFKNKERTSVQGILKKIENKFNVRIVPEFGP